MKSTLTKEEYKTFTKSVDFLKKEHDINIPHIVEEVNGKFIVELLEDIDVKKLDNILENAWQQTKKLIDFMEGRQRATEQALYLHVLVGLVLTTTPRVVGSQLSLLT